MACESVRVTEALCSDDLETASAIKVLLASQQSELVLRALVLLQKLTGSHGYDDESLGFISMNMSEGLGVHSEADKEKVRTVLVEWEKMKVVRVQAATYLVRNTVMTALQELISLGDGLDEEMILLVQDVIKSVSDVMYSIQDEP